MRKIGLALGGGGVHGVAHALVLEALDELDLRPSIIAGTSIGAIMGAIYASGQSGLAILETIQKNTVSKSDNWRAVLKKRSDQLKLLRTFSLTREPGGIFRTDRFLNFLLGSIHKRTFEELDIPLIVVATDLWSGEEVTISSGDLHPALHASIAIPGVFPPVAIDGQVLVDGGMVDLVPYEHVIDSCDFTIAVNVLGDMRPVKRTMPRAMDSMLRSLEIMQKSTFFAKIKHRPPDIIVSPDIVNINILDFNKTDEAMKQAMPAIEAFKKELKKKLLNS